MTMATDLIVPTTVGVWSNTATGNPCRIGQLIQNARMSCLTLQHKAPEPPTNDRKIPKKQHPLLMIVAAVFCLRATLATLATIEPLF
ncbi:hypothetical protein Q4595_25540, partial [Wenyingzhuangia sp. 1_MG-2023]|nr:hypothetical protein [Wenyingzhuangia sp. 1_MG-2023]